MLSLRRGTVETVVDRLDGLVRLQVNGRDCIAYPRLTGAVAVGDEVIVNVQAVELGLGSGGFDILYANLTRGLELPADPGAHVMKLPYTPLQHAVRHSEEEGGGEQMDLGGMPVVCCSLHSQLAPVCAGLGVGVDVAYVQLSGGALPVSLSDTVRILRQRGFLEAALAPGSSFDGEIACVTVPSALAWCAGRGMRAVVCSIGPGIAGTGTRFGHGGVAAAAAANAATALGGTPILAPRLSEVDDRERHRGLSHHSLAAIDLSLGSIKLAWPAGFPAPDPARPVELVDVTGWEEACADLPLLHMGRRPDEDPSFFAAAFAAGRLALGLVS